MTRALTILTAVIALAFSAPASAGAVTGGVDAVDCLMTSFAVTPLQQSQQENQGLIKAKQTVRLSSRDEPETI